MYTKTELASQKALELADETIVTEHAKAALKDDDPVVDLKLASGEAVLTLTLNMSGVWRPEYVFSLLPVGLDKVDVLDSKQRDLEEEVIQLRKQVAELTANIEVAKAEGRRPPVLSLTSVTTTGCGEKVVWGGITPRIVTDSHFQVSANNVQVTILQPGLYQVHVRLGGTNAANSQSLGLQRNGVDIAICIQSDANNYQNTAQLFEILELAINDVLQVRCGANNSSLANENSSRFSIVYLGN